MHISNYLFAFVSVWLLLSIYVYLFIYLSRSVYLFIYVSVLSIYPSGKLCICQYYRKINKQRDRQTYIDRQDNEAPNLFTLHTVIFRCVPV